MFPWHLWSRWDDVSMAFVVKGDDVSMKFVVKVFTVRSQFTKEKK